MLAWEGRLRPSLIDWRNVVWAMPLVGFVVARAVPLRLEQLAVVIVAAGVVALAARRPDISVLLLIGLIVFDQLARMILFELGVPAGAVRGLGRWNEGLLLGAALAAAHAFWQSRRRLDTLDRLTLAYVGILLAHLVLPDVFADGPVRPLDARIESFRTHAMLPASLLIARHAPLRASTARRARSVILLVGAVLGALAIIEFTASDGWNRFVIETIDANRYWQVIDGSTIGTTDVRWEEQIAGRIVTRIGSVVLDPIHIAFFVCIPVGIGIEYMARRAVRPLVFLAVGLSGAAVILTLTRSATLAALVSVLAALRAGRNRRETTRAQVALLGVAALMLLVPVLANQGFGDRLSQGLDSDSDSTSLHLERSSKGVRDLIEHPLGLGLAAGPSVGSAFGFRPADDLTCVCPENHILLVGNEVGALAMVLFVAIFVSTIGRLKEVSERAGHAEDDAVLAGGAFVVLVGLLVGSLFLHTWTDIHTIVTAWVTAGIALNVGRVQDEDSSDTSSTKRAVLTSHR